MPGEMDGICWSVALLLSPLFFLSFFLALLPSLSYPHPPLHLSSPFFFSLFSLFLSSLLRTSFPLIPFLCLSSFSPFRYPLLSPLCSPSSSSQFFLLFSLSEQTQPAHPHSPGLCRSFRPFHPCMTHSPSPGHVPRSPRGCFPPQPLRQPRAASPRGRG